MNVFIINGHEHWEKSPGRLNKTLTEYAEKFFRRRNDNVKITYAHLPYYEEEEVQKILWADVVIFITPVFWMNITASLKEYMDRVYSANKGRFYEGDGRKNGGQYGTGGFLQDKKYMLITTWNAPQEAFGNKGQYLFEGKTVDDIFANIHAAQRYTGMQKLPSFSLHDVIHKPDIKRFIKDFNTHLQKVFI